MGVVRGVFLALLLGDFVGPLLGVVGLFGVSRVLVGVLALMRAAAVGVVEGVELGVGAEITASASLVLAVSAVSAACCEE